MENEIVVYANNYRSWTFQPPDTLVWAGIGGCITLDIDEVERVCKRARKLYEKKKEGSK